MTEVRGAPDAVLDGLAAGELELSGRLIQASNATFVGRVTHRGHRIDCVYKPVRGERPLWDFPSGTLAGREVAAYLVSELAGWHVVPPTVLGDGPFGPGMLQAWVETTTDAPVDVVGREEIPEGWLHVLDAYDGHDNPVALVHADRADLREMALFDIVVNNADRKGGHILCEGADQLLGCDHGVCFNVEEKLRTVLWGWAGQPLTPDEHDRLHRLRDLLAGQQAHEQLCGLISPSEYEALLDRVDALVTVGELPVPGEHWPSIPWPAF